MAGIILLDSVSEDTTGSAKEQEGVELTVFAWASDWGGGTVTFESSIDGGITWLKCRQRSDECFAMFTGNGISELQPIGQVSEIRAVLSGSTSPSGVNARFTENH